MGTLYLDLLSGPSSVSGAGVGEPTFSALFGFLPVVRWGLSRGFHPPVPPSASDPWSWTGEAPWPFARRRGAPSAESNGPTLSFPHPHRYTTTPSYPSAWSGPTPQEYAGGRLPPTGFGHFHATHLSMLSVSVPGWIAQCWRGGWRWRGPTPGAAPQLRGAPVWPAAGFHLPAPRRRNCTPTFWHSPTPRVPPPFRVSSPLPLKTVVHPSRRSGGRFRVLRLTGSPPLQCDGPSCISPLGDHSPSVRPYPGPGRRSGADSRPEVSPVTS